MESLVGLVFYLSDLKFFGRCLGQWPFDFFFIGINLSFPWKLVTSFYEDHGFPRTCVINICTHVLVSEKECLSWGGTYVWLYFCGLAADVTRLVAEDPKSFAGQNMFVDPSITSI